MKQTLLFKALEKEKKLHEDSFNSISKNKFALKLNDDLSELIKQELIKKTSYSFADINKHLIKLILSIYKKIFHSIHTMKEIKVNYTNTHLITPDDVKLIYDIIFIILKHFPNKNIKLEKYKFSKVRKYFIYKIGAQSFKSRRPFVEFLVFDYSDYDEHSQFFWIYTARNEPDLKYMIKDNFKMFNPLKNKKQKVSMNRSERSSKFKSRSIESSPSSDSSGSF
jgi:hypothetical protein